MFISMSGIISTATESTPVEQLEQMEPIEPSDLTVTNLKNFFESMLPVIRSLAFNIIVCLIIILIGRKLIRLLHQVWREHRQTSDLPDSWVPRWRFFSTSF